MIPSLRLKKREDTRIRQGHVWIYSNEIDTTSTPLSHFQPGQLVCIEDAHAKALGLGYVNPHTLLCARLLSRNVNATINRDFFLQRIKQALAWREQLFIQPFYRLIYGEGDNLPGLIVDRYDKHLVVQITTAGMEAFKDTILDALHITLKPISVLWRNDHSMRKLEGLTEYVEAALGDPPQDIIMTENEVRFCISPWTGQKTGWFYDHRDNRAQLKRYVAGKRVLDLFSYVGGWSIQAAVFGAKEVLAIDTSRDALEKLNQNAMLNHVSDRVTTLQGDVFDALKALADKREKFDVIIIDPPAFIKKRKDQKQGLIAYKRVNELAMRLLNSGGFFISSSCSQHLSQADLGALILTGAAKICSDVQLLGIGTQGADHPLHLAIPEMHYLKALFCRIETRATHAPH